MIDNIELRREIQEYIGKLKSAEDISTVTLEKVTP